MSSLGLMMLMVTSIGTAAAAAAAAARAPHQELIDRTSSGGGGAYTPLFCGGSNGHEDDDEGEGHDEQGLWVNLTQADCSVTIIPLVTAYLGLNPNTASLACNGAHGVGGTLSNVNGRVPVFDCTAVVTALNAHLGGSPFLCNHANNTVIKAKKCAKTVAALNVALRKRRPPSPLPTLSPSLPTPPPPPTFLFKETPLFCAGWDTSLVPGHVDPANDDFFGPGTQAQVLWVNVSSDESECEDTVLPLLATWLGGNITADELGCNDLGSDDNSVIGADSASCSTVVAALNTRLGGSAFSCYNEGSGIGVHDTKAEHTCREKVARMNDELSKIPPPTSSPTRRPTPHPPTTARPTTSRPTTPPPSGQTARSRLSPSQIAGITAAAIAAAVLLTAAVLTVGRRTAAASVAHLQRQVSEQMVLLSEAGQNTDEMKEELERRNKVWQIPEDHITFVTRLASGGYGEVWRGTYGGQTVAIKLLKRPLDDEFDPDAAEDYRRENEVLQQIRHPHLLLFLGSGSTAAERRPFLVTEYMELGSLCGVLADSTRELSWATRVRMADEIAAGMSHLHSLGIVHRDLKSDNCLCDADLNTKIADFGTSKLMRAAKGGVRPIYEDTPFAVDATVETRHSTCDWDSAYETMTKGAGTLLWMAPEVFAGGSQYGSEVDVYSYGVIMWELVTRRQPWDEIEAGTQSEFKRQFEQALMSGRRPAVAAEVREQHPVFTAVMQSCWASEPRARPTFEVVVEQLRNAQAGGF